MTLEGTDRLDELTRGQQILAAKIVEAGLATADEVVKAFAARDNGKIGRWKQALETSGLMSDKTSGTTLSQQRRAAGREGMARSPWNMGHLIGGDPGLIR